MSIDDGSALIGRTIAGKFVVEAVLGVGGTGAVYRARQIALDRTVALKVLHAELACDDHFIARFKREARAASRLEHRSSVRVLDFGQHEDASLYLAMEYVQGRTLFNVLKQEWPLDDARIVRILSQVLSALGVAHDLAVIHRDLKPENIIIVRGLGEGDDGEEAELAKVCDFGIATLGAVVRDERAQPGEPRVTLRGAIVGTPAYMSPEQVRGELADQRSDLYSAGVVLYHMLAGRLPFEDDNPWALALRHVSDPLVPPSVVAHVPVHPGLEAVCCKAMSKRPEDRFANAREMRAALRAALGPEAGRSGDSTPAPGVSLGSAPALTAVNGEVRPTLAGASRRRGWRVVGAAASLATTVLLGAITLIHRPSPVPPPPAVPAIVERRPAPVAPAVVTASVGNAHSSPSDGTHRVAAPEAPPRRPPHTARKPARGKEKRQATPALDEAVAVAPAPALTAPAPQPAPAPPPPAVVAPAAPAPTPAPPPRPAPPDPSRASISVTAVTTTNAIPGANVRAAIARLPILRCYREALRAQGAAAGGTARLRLKVDVAGYVTAAALEDADFLPAMKACIEGAARALRVKDVDTGEGTALVTIRFTPAP